MLKKLNRKKIVVLLLLVSICSGLFLFQQAYRSPKLVIGNDLGANEFVKDMNGEDLKRYLQEKADKNYFRLSMDTVMRFADSESLGTVNIQNAPNNQYSLQVVTYLSEGEKKIYDSGLIKPKQFVSEGKLLRKLAKGNYETISKVKYFDASGNELGESSVIGELIIEA